VWKVSDVRDHAITRYRERIASRFGQSRKRYAVTRSILHGVSEGVRLTAQEVYKLGLKFRRGYEYIRNGDVVYVIGRSAVITVVVVGGGAALFLMQSL
jgi:hypothetical protein